MKKILLACGSGICTSTAVNGKISKILDDAGFKGKYQVTQCKVAEITAKSGDYDFCIATTMAPKEVNCPFIMGVCFLTGVGTQPAIDQILKLMKA